MTDPLASEKMAPVWVTLLGFAVIALSLTSAILAVLKRL